MRQFFLTVAGVFAGMTLFAVSIIAFFAVMSASVQSGSDASGGPVPSATVLTLDLRVPLADQSALSGFSAARTPSVLGAVDALARAETDDRVKGIFIRASEYGMPLAQAQELHDAILAFRAAGKFAIVHAQGFEGPSVSSYLLASAADEIWLQDTANFVATGLAAQTPFFGEAFAKYGIEPEFEQFYEYKNAVNTYTESDYTDAHREAMTALLDSLYGSAVEAAATSREEAAGSPAALRALLEGAPYTAERALELKLVDKLGHVVDAKEAALALAGDDADEMELFAYHRSAGGAFHSGPVIALVAGQGAVSTGEQPESFFGDSDGFYSDTIAQAILDAAEDDAVKAIVLRIDSPGGSAIASDQVWHAVERAKEAGKPVVASFAALAASGGYYVAAGADAIVAEPTTITGSIGVFGGKFVVEDLLGRFGVHYGTLSVGGDYVTAYSGFDSFTDEQRQAFHDMMAETYADFTTRVADGRGLALDVVLANARGRVWTGADALQIGLVDELGGLRTAIDRAKALADIDAEDGITLRRFPAEKSPFEVFQSLFGVSAEGAQAIATLNAIADIPEVRAAIEARERAGADQTLLAPPIEVE